MVRLEDLMLDIIQANPSNVADGKGLSFSTGGLASTNPVPDVEVQHVFLRNIFIVC